VKSPVVESNAFWISGPVQSGKTEALIAQLEQWVLPLPTLPKPPRGIQDKSLLVFAANADNRTVLMQRMVHQLQGQGNIESTTPLAFFEQEVLLFWPLVIQQLQLRGYFPYRLRPEAEQALALKLWGNDLITRLQKFEPMAMDPWGRRILDLIQLAASSGTPLNRLAQRLKTGDPVLEVSDELAELIQQMALQWQEWCLTHGLLTYGLITDLFWQYLLPHDTYRKQLSQRFSAIAADDLNHYPAITRPLFEQFLDLGLPGVFTYSPLGSVREGLGADPAYLLGLKSHCTEVVLTAMGGIGWTEDTSLEEMTAQFQQPLPQSAPEFYTLQTISRIHLLQQVAQAAISAIQRGEIQPQELAIVGPGLDPLARYTLMETFQRAGVAVESLRDQRPLQSVAIVRALLTLLALVYPGLGHLIEAEQVAELLVLLTAQNRSDNGVTVGGIDAVRAGLLADYCFRPDRDRPELLPIEVYARWDRLGHNTAQAYETLRHWILQQQSALGSTLTLNPVFMMDRAIQTFLTQKPLSIDQLAVLRELIETAQHYWEVDARLRKIELDWPTLPETIEAFIKLLRRGVVTANPYPVQNIGNPRSAIVLATTFQYLNARLQHRCQYWLDAGSQLWQYSGAMDLWGAPLFLQATLSKTQGPEDVLLDPNRRFQNTLIDLLGRVSERVYLCHSELGVNGQPQIGPLLPWVEMAIPILSDVSTLV
jgi:hypothetical protein